MNLLAQKVILFAAFLSRNCFHVLKDSVSAHTGFVFYYHQSK